MNRLIILLFITFSTSVITSAQKIVPSAGDLYADALEYILAGDYNEALPVLLSLQSKGYSGANISYKIGECYLNIQGQKIKSIPYLKEAVSKTSQNYSGESLEEEYAPLKSLLYLGIAYRLSNDFNNAVSCLKKYLNTVDDVNKEERALAEYHIERCNFARELMASPMKFTTDTLTENINTTESNFNPVVSSFESVIYYMNKLKFYDAVMHADKADGKWPDPENITPEVKSDGDHLVTGVSSDGTKLFFTCYDPYLSGEIYTSEFKDGKWSELRKLNNEINTRFNETHASLSPDGKYLYFTSDRKGGYGGLDVYRSALDATGGWGAAENLGPLINSPYNEETPFQSTDTKKLFFSSQGHYNMGGYDIFYSSLNSDGNWLPPVNIGYPVNTTDDDLFFFPTGSGNSGYQSRYASNSGQQDIVRFSISSFGKPARFTLNGKIDVQADTGCGPADISVAFIEKNLNDTMAVKPLSNDGSFSQKLPGGTYRLDFNDKSGLLLTKELDIPEYLPQNNLVLREEIDTRRMISLADTFLLKDIRFDFDKSMFGEKSKEYLNNVAGLMVKYPGLNLQVNGYTDALGKESYNAKLSLLRATSVQNYLLTLKPVSEKISVKAFGENNPVAVNTTDGKDNPSGRSYNRRVELVFSNVPAGLIILRIVDIPENLLNK